MVKGVTNPCCDSDEKIIEKSQGVQSHLQRQQGSAVGHPLFHVLCKKESTEVIQHADLPFLNCTDAITKRQGNRKTAFQTKRDQQMALHEILASQVGKQALDQLNSGRDEVVLKMNVANFMPGLMMTEVSNGNRQAKSNAISVVLILGHHVNKPEGMYVHVKTFYPSNKHIVEGYSIQ